LLAFSFILLGLGKWKAVESGEVMMLYKHMVEFPDLSNCCGVVCDPEAGGN
jgi:hypothetical protein